VDDKTLLGNDPVKQQWKGGNRCQAMAQYTGVNNGVKDVFCVVGAVVISRVWSQLRNSSDNRTVTTVVTTLESTEKSANAVLLKFEVL
jgi:hypothetical protein